MSPDTSTVTSPPARENDQRSCVVSLSMKHRQLWRTRSDGVDSGNRPLDGVAPAGGPRRPRQNFAFRLISRLRGGFTVMKSLP